jgi:hypothetical protein
MAAAIGETFLIDPSVTLLRSTAASVTIGYGVILTADTLDGGGAGTCLPFNTAAGIAAALAASKIGATTAANLTAAIGQDGLTPTIYVVTYGVGAPSDALDIAIAAGLDVGVFMLQTTSESALETLAVWLAADDRRKAKYLMIAQSADTGLYGGSKPASLSDLEQLGCRVFYSADTEPTAAAYLGRLAGSNLLTTPPAARFRPLGVLPTTATETQVQAIIDNDACVVTPFDYGSSADERITLGTKAYNGNDWSASVRLVYIARQLAAAMAGVIQQAAIAGVGIYATSDGFAKTNAAAEGFLGQLPAAYFVPQPTAPSGYTIVSEATTVGDDVYITTTVTCWFGREATKIAIPVIGQEV